MRFQNLFLLSASALAVPLLREREANVVTVTDWEIQTVTSYTTIWAASPSSDIAGQQGSKPSPVAAIQQDHQTHAINAKSTVVPAIAPQPTTSTVPIVVPPQPTPNLNASPVNGPKDTKPVTQPANQIQGGKYGIGLLDGASVANGPCTPGQSCHGDITHFNPSMGAGACGYKDWTAKTIWQDTDDVVAVSSNIMGSYSNGGTPDNVNELCKRSVYIKAQKGGQDVVARVVDKCPTCPGNFDLDLSPQVFAKVAPNGDGRVHNVEWYWV